MKFKWFLAGFCGAMLLATAACSSSSEPSSGKSTSAPPVDVPPTASAPIVPEAPLAPLTPDLTPEVKPKTEPVVPAPAPVPAPVAPPAPAPAPAPVPAPVAPPASTSVPVTPPPPGPAPAPIPFAPDCTVCHADLIAKQVRHEVAVIDCTTCHEEHGKKTRYPDRLKALPNRLCLNCHEQDLLRLQGGHVVAGHPIFLESDPRFDTGNPYIEKRPFNCVSCHSPHSSKMPKLFRYDYTKAPYNGLLCAVCHGDKVGIPTEDGDNPLPPESIYSR